MREENKDFLRKYWGDETLKAIEEAIRKEDTETPRTMDEFLKHCTACGGNWGGMLLTGIKDLFPAVWDAIPDNMGIQAWGCLCSVIALCGVQTGD